MSAVKSWSFSAWEQFNLCPAQYKYQRLDKLPTADKPFFAKGSEAHKHLENVVLRKETLNPKIVPKEQIVPLEILSLPATVKIAGEEKWGFTPRWSRTGWGDATLRLVNDVLIDYGDGSAEVVDWKTGGKWGAGEYQMELAACATFHRFPDLQYVTTRLVYVEKGGQSISDHDRSELPALTARWEARADELFAERDWRPRPNEKCHWCDFGKSKGGPCRYG